MNHVTRTRNRIHSYFYMYGIEETEENFEKLEEVIENKEFRIHHKILYMVDNCGIVEEDSTGITIEIDLLQHHKLLDDLTNNFFAKKISARKVEKKIGHTYFVGNPFLTRKIYNEFR